MSDILRKLTDPVVSSITFDPVVYRAEPGRCISYQFSSRSSTVSDVPLEDLRAIEFSLKQVLNNVVRPEIDKRVKQAKHSTNKGRT